MSTVTQKELNDEFNALAEFFSVREISPEVQVAICGAAIGGIIGRNREAGLVDDLTAKRMLNAAFARAQYVVFPPKQNAVDGDE
ncbi:hypothetical protein [Salinisphaera sp. T31B1]|uniref:hypothetical protein n=1 Tax=Salinisphaera sp. T31B1 TaxID=727963 RepID=UPI00333E3E8C